jgi:transposase
MQPDLPVQQGTVIVLPPSDDDQPELFSDPDVGAELLRIESDAAAGKATGSTLAARIEMRDQICERLCGGMSIREVCRLYHVGRNTVSALVRRLESAGKMEPVKRRLAAKLSQVAEMSADLLLERIDGGDVPTNVLPISMGVACDKKAAMEERDAEATEAPEPGLDWASFNAAVAALPRASDSQSDAQATKPEETPHE